MDSNVLRNSVLLKEIHRIKNKQWIYIRVQQTTNTHALNHLPVKSHQELLCLLSSPGISRPHQQSPSTPSQPCYLLFSSKQLLLLSNSRISMPSTPSSLQPVSSIQFLCERILLFRFYPSFKANLRSSLLQKTLPSPLSSISLSSDSVQQQVYNT